MAWSSEAHDLHVVLVEPEIHWNAGNTGRSCLAAGAQLHLVRPLGFSLDDRQVRRAGLDYWPRVKPVVWSSWRELQDNLPSLGEPFFVTPDAARAHWSVRYPRPTVLLFGRESVGFSPELRAKYREQSVRLPMIDPELRSVNVSTCAGVVMYEVRRQWAAGPDGS